MFGGDYDSSIAIVIGTLGTSDAEPVTSITLDTIHLCYEMADAVGFIYYVNDAGAAWSNTIITIQVYGWYKYNW